MTTTPTAKTMLELADELDSLAELLSEATTGSEAGFDRLCKQAAVALRSHASSVGVDGLDAPQQSHLDREKEAHNTRTNVSQMKLQIIALLKSKVNVYTPADDIAPHVTNAEDVADAILSLANLTTSSLGADDDTSLEVWHGDRKVTIYKNEVMRIWGPDMEDQMSSEQRDHQTVAAAFDWLYGE